MLWRFLFYDAFQMDFSFIITYNKKSIAMIFLHWSLIWKTI